LSVKASWDIFCVVVDNYGDIGVTWRLARQLAAADIASRIVLVDDMANVAAGKALDVAQSGPVDGYSTALSGTSDVAAVVGAKLQNEAEHLRFFDPKTEAAI